MARPLSENQPIDTSLNCKISRNDMDKLSSLSYTTGVPKSEVIRRMIRFAYVFMNDATYQVRCEEEKSGNKYSMDELREKINQKIEDEYAKFFDFDRLQDGDIWMCSADDNLPMKMHKSTFTLSQSAKDKLKKMQKQIDEMNKNGTVSLDKIESINKKLADEQEKK